MQRWDYSARDPEARVSQFFNAGQYDARDAMILWDEVRGRVCHVTVVSFPAHRIYPQSPLWDVWRRLSENWNFAFGSLSLGWMSCDTARPEALFSYFIITDFSSRAEEERAYSEFARIRECDWARRTQLSPGLAADALRVYGT